MRWLACGLLACVLWDTRVVSAQDLKATTTTSEGTKVPGGAPPATISSSATKERMEIGPSLSAVGLRAARSRETAFDHRGLVVDTDDNKPTAVADFGKGIGLASRSKGEAALGRPVGLIVFADAMGREVRRCTGWLITAIAVVTNAHCIKDDAATSRVSFDYVDGTDYSTLKWYSCSLWPKSVLVEADLALLKCGETTAAPGDTYGVETLGAAPVADNDSVMVIHQYCDAATVANCEPTKKTVRSRVARASYSSFEFSHLADTAPGSSGAPVFAISGVSRGMVVGVHHGGCSLANDCKAAAPSGRGVFNLAIQLKVLRKYLETLHIVD